MTAMQPTFSRERILELYNEYKKKSKILLSAIRKHKCFLCSPQDLPAARRAIEHRLSAARRRPTPEAVVHRGGDGIPRRAFRLVSSGHSPQQ